MSDIQTPAGEGGRADLLGSRIGANHTKSSGGDQRYPSIAGSKGASDTGPAGSKKIGRRVQTIRGSSLAALASGPATAEQIAQLIGEHFMIVRARCSELRAQGLIEDSGERGSGALGGKVIVWRLTTPEERAWNNARKSAEAEHSAGADR